jgi:hypothetical protein
MTSASFRDNEDFRPLAGTRTIVGFLAADEVIGVGFIVVPNIAYSVIERFIHCQMEESNGPAAAGNFMRSLRDAGPCCPPFPRIEIRGYRSSGPSGTHGRLRQAIQARDPEASRDGCQVQEDRYPEASHDGCQVQEDRDPEASREGCPVQEDRAPVASCEGCQDH